MLIQHRERHRRVVLARGGFSNRYSMVFDGVDEHISLGNADIIADGASSASYSLWVNTSVGGSNQFLYGRFNGGVAATTPAIFLISGVPRFFMAPGIGDFRDGTTDISDGFWHHLLCIFVGSSKLDIYLDGVLDNGALFGVIRPSVPANSVDNRIATQADGDNYFAGNIDEVGAFQADLSANVAETYNGGEPDNLLNHSQVANLKGYWRMGDGATFGGGNWSIPDESTNSNTGTSANMEEADRVTNVP